ncbi:LOW QUALITY PROTEIN: glioma pathogenesis-related protein 1-like [Perca flavescens]|uniref:LOW QUALITY PROTEIN: glioma pathogenesis-related protein 1-like n=1 Tax=Perca flavescens TaxID=8167 RepID=UPI00106E067C|nr:LOW QUALITY PROTEIN: glioma pathogenesis-related protein 1-like [Perca flavescens]
MGIVVMLLLTVLDSGVCSVSLPEITDGKFIDECVREHNEARSSVSPSASDMLYMTWDDGLAITARAWARHCVFEHNTYLKDVMVCVHPTFSSFGENNDQLAWRSRASRAQRTAGYNWTPDWDPALATSGSNYATILIVRPTALIFTFITAYAIHHFYPDVFCYE